MKHILLTSETCPCDKNDYERDCPVCDWGLNVCSVCGGAEGDLIGDDGKENKCVNRLREAAKRLLELAAMPIEKQKDYVRQWPELGWDGILLARDYMAKNPEKSGSFIAIIDGNFWGLPAWADSDAQIVWDRFIAESNEQDDPNCPLWGYLVDLGGGG